MWLLGIAIAHPNLRQNSPLAKIFAVSVLKYFFCSRDAVEGRREAGIDRHLDHDFDDFLSGASDIEGAVNMYF